MNALRIMAVAVVVSVGALTGCGSGGGGNTGGGSATGGGSTATGGGSAATGGGSATGGGAGDAGVTCTYAMATYSGAMMGGGQYAPTDGGTNDFQQFQGYFGTMGPSATNLVDVFSVELYAGSGALANGIASGTYTLSGDDLNYKTCGICVRGLTRFDGANNSADDYYVKSGSVTITPATMLNGTISGSLTNVVLQHVTINGTTYQSTPVNDGCEISIPSATFSGTAGP